MFRLAYCIKIFLKCKLGEDRNCLYTDVFHIPRTLFVEYKLYLKKCLYINSLLFHRLF
jgi:hypothetical protein